MERTGLARWAAPSHICFRMHNTYIIDLFDKVQVGANVSVVP